MAHQLAPGERVIVVTRPHPRTLVMPALFFLLVPAICAFAAGALLRRRAEFDGAVSAWVPAAVWLTAALGLVLVLLCCLRPLLRWLGTSYVLTSWRLTIRTGSFRRQEQQSHLAAIVQINLSQSLLQRALRCGNIALELGHGRTITYVDVPEVEKFRNILTQTIEQLPQTAMFDGAGFDIGFDEGQEIGRSTAGGYRSYDGDYERD